MEDDTKELVVELILREKLVQELITNMGKNYYNKFVLDEALQLMIVIIKTNKKQRRRFVHQVEKAKGVEVIEELQFLDDGFVASKAKTLLEEFNSPQPAFF